METTTTEDKIIRMEAVQALTGGYSRSSLWRLEKEGLFPKRVKIGPRAVGWKLSEIQEWIRSRSQKD